MNVGYGDIGKSCGLLARAYGMTVIGYKRSLEKDSVRVDRLEVCISKMMMKKKKKKKKKNSSYYY